MQKFEHYFGIALIPRLASKALSGLGFASEGRDARATNIGMRAALIPAGAEGSICSSKASRNSRSIGFVDGTINVN